MGGGEELELLTTYRILIFAAKTKTVLSETQPSNKTDYRILIAQDRESSNNYSYQFSRIMGI